MHNRTYDLKVWQSFQSGRWGRILIFCAAFFKKKKKALSLYLCVSRVRGVWFMSSYIRFYFIFTNGTFTSPPPPTYAFLFISHPVPETSVVSNFPKPLHQKQWHPAPKLPSSLPPSSLSPSIPPSLHPRSVYGFDFALRFIRSIPMRTSPSPLFIHSNPFNNIGRCCKSKNPWM